MRGVRPLLVLLVVAFGLGAYIYFVESKRDLEDPSLKKDKVFSVEAGKIDEIEVRPASGDATTLKKNGSDWQVVAPVTASADQSAAGSLATTLETLDVQKSLDDNPSSVAQYGLDPARFSVSFKTAGDSTTHQLSVGGKTPTGSDLYARVEGQPKLFLISGYLEDTLNRSTFDLRDKTVLKFDRDAVDTVTIAPKGGKPVSLVRKGADWRLTSPLDVRADTSAVDTLLSRMTTEQMKALVAGEQTPASPKDLKTYGLDQPQLVLTLGAGSNRASLALGAKKDDATIYARDLSRPLVFAVDTGLLTDASKTADDFRVKDVFQFKSFDAQSLDITRGTTTSAFSKSKPAGGDASAAEVWRETTPETRDLNQTGMTDFLNTLSSLRADKFVDRPLASGDDVAITARFGDASKPTEERVTLRRSGDVVQAIRPNEPGAAVIPTADFDKAMSQLKDLAGGK
jgi:Domain of unknown function (DUF4340)